jgi:hypothetical protein
MNKEELVCHIRKSWIYAKALKVDELFAGPTSLEASDSYKKLSTGTNVTYEELYLVGLREGQYNILLRDYSYFQFGVGGGGVRFAYCPNPFLGTASEAITELSEMQEYVVEGIIGVDEFLHRASEIRRPQHPPLIRYDYSKSQYLEESHPCSHLHIGLYQQDRWPVRRCLTAHAFTLFVFRLFYIEFWLKADSIGSGSQKISIDMALNAARAECRQLYSDEFSEEEGRRFHII